MNCLISITKYLRYQYGTTLKTALQCVHLRNFNKQHIILENFYVNNASCTSNQSAKFQLNLPAQTIGLVTGGFSKVTPKREVSSIKQPHGLFNPDSVHGTACLKISRLTF